MPGNGAIGSRALIITPVSGGMGISIDKEGAIGDIDTPVATGAVNSTDKLFARIKRIETAIVDGSFSTAAVEAILGALTDAAASGAVTNTDTLTAYIKQLVTELQVVDALIDTITTNTDSLEASLGGIATATHAGAVDNLTTAIAYIKQLVTLQIAADIVLATIATDTTTDIPATITTLTANLATLQAEFSGAAGIASFPAGAAAANAVSLAEVVRYIQDQLLAFRAEITGTAGIAAWAGPAAPANNVSLHEVIQKLYVDLRGGGGAWPAEAFPANNIGIMDAILYASNGIRKSGGAALSAAKSLVDAIGSNGLVLDYSAGSALGAVGTRFNIKGYVKSANIITVGADLINAVGANDDFYVHEILLETDSTGLAIGTDIEIRSDSSYGLALLAKTTVAKLGALKTIRLTVDGETGYNFKGHRVTGLKKLTINTTGLNCTGNGMVQVTLLCERLAAGSTGVFNSNLVV